MNRRSRSLGAPPPPQKSARLPRGRPPLPRRLLLQRAERTQLALGGDHSLNGGGAERANQLVLQIRLADVEAQLLHAAAAQASAEARALERAPEVRLLPRVAEAGQAHVR